MTRNAQRKRRLWLRNAATTTEYLLIMALIILPLGLMLPLFMKMIRLYSGRIVDGIGSPFP